MYAAQSVIWMTVSFVNSDSLGYRHESYSKQPQTFYSVGKKFVANFKVIILFQDIGGRILSSIY